MVIPRASLAAALLAALVAGAVAPSHAEEFACPPGARDSGHSPETHPGTVVRWCEITRDGRPLYHGPVWRWHRNGQLEGKEYYVNGNAEGEWRSWYEDGTPRSSGTFRDGTKVGHWIYRNDTGKIETEVTYTKDGNDVVEYYPGGARKFEGRFRRSGKIGPWVYWNPDGTEKARCDFGAGLFELHDAACRTIAEELWPKGFSRPVPTAVKGAGSKTEIRIAAMSYELSAPPGWVADAEAGGAEGTALALYPEGGSWRGDGPNVYFRVIFKDGRNFDEIVAGEGKEFRDNVADYEETSLPDRRTEDGVRVVSKTLSYRPVIQTDSPFAIVADNTIHEAIDFLDLSDRLVLVAVLACHSAAERDENLRLLHETVNALRVVR